MPRAKIEAAFLGHYTLVALDAAPDAEAAWLIHALCAWILRDELPKEVPPERAAIWNVVRVESELVSDSMKESATARSDAAREAAAARWRKRTDANACERMPTDANACVEMLESKKEIEKEKSRAIALEARAPACERIPESLAEEEAAWTQFWNAYPRRDYESNARRAWHNLFGTLPPKPETLAAILAAVRRDRASDQWREDGGRYIPTAAKWLANRAWEVRNDALPPPSPKSNVPAAPDYAAEEKEREKRDLAAAAAALKRMTW